CDINDQTPAKRADMEKWSRVFAVVTPLAVVAIILIMVLPSIFPSLPALRGGEAAGLVGGVAFILMMFATAAACGFKRMLDVCPEHMTDGFVFAFRAMGSVLPIAGFFFLGANEATAAILGVPQSEEPNLLFELIASGQRSEEHTSELQSRKNLVCRLLLEKKNIKTHYNTNFSNATQ